MGDVITFPGKPQQSKPTTRLDTVATLGTGPIDIDAKFIAYAIVELTSEERQQIIKNPLLTDPIEAKLKKLGWPMEHGRFIEAYAHMIRSIRNISD